jgi:hypothetical protein
MCNTHSNGHAHGVRSDAGKAVADLRDDLIEELKLVTKYEAQIPVIGAEDFPEVDDVVQVLGHIRDEHQHAVNTLIEFINRLDADQKTAGAHEDRHEHGEAHEHQSAAGR